MTDETTAKAKKNILLVEDESVLRQLYKEILEEEGFLVTEAADGETAYSFLISGGYDLILLDIVLPKLDGIEILKKLQKEKPAKPNGPIIILTNLGQESIVAEGIGAGVRGYLLKSDITPDQVIAEVKKALNMDG
jgi:DNA-binding response OmpR family regulator